MIPRIFRIANRSVVLVNLTDPTAASALYNMINNCADSTANSAAGNRRGSDDDVDICIRLVPTELPPQLSGITQLQQIGKGKRGKYWESPKFQYGKRKKDGSKI